MSTHTIFTDMPHCYARYRPRYPQRLIDDLRAQSVGERGEHAVEWGCGTGELTLPLSRFFQRVTAIDASEPMIEVAEAGARLEEVDNVEWRVGRAEDLEIDAESCDLIAAAAAFHWMDRELLAGRAMRALKPGAALALVAGGGAGGVREMTSEWHRLVTECVRRHAPAPPSDGGRKRVRPKRSQEDVLRAAGFEVESAVYPTRFRWDVDEVIGYLYSISFPSPLALGERRTEFERDVREALGRIDPAGEIRQTLDFTLAVARRPAPPSRPIASPGNDAAALEAVPVRRLADTEIFHAMPADSDTVVVSFGAKGGGHHHFHFFRVLEPLPGFSKLLVRDPAGAWYNAGLPGAGETLEQIAAAIAAELARLGARRVITSGSSMGGYAAILFGCMLGAERAIALAPQTLLDRDLRHAPAAAVQLQAPDLAPIVRDSPDTRIDLVAGWDDPLDVFNAQRIARLPSVRVLALRGGTHRFVEDLHRDGVLIPLLTTLIEGETPAIFEVDPVLDADVEARIADTAYAVQREDWQVVVERIGPVAIRHPDWVGPSFELGRALAELGDRDRAEAPLRRVTGARAAWGVPHPLAEQAERLLEPRQG